MHVKRRGLLLAAASVTALAGRQVRADGREITGILVADPDRADQTLAAFRTWRARHDAGCPAASVDAVKQRRLTDLALHFLQKHRLLNHSARFDVLAVSWPVDRREPSITHYRNAFEAVGRFQTYS